MASELREYTIGDIAAVVGGSTPSTANAANFDGDIPWLTPKDLSGPHGRYVSRGARNLTEKGLESCSAQLLPAKTVLLSSRAPIGYVAIAKNPIATNQGFRNLILKPGFVPEFVYYWLRAHVPELERHASGSTFKELSGSALKLIRILVPSETTQKAIAKILGTLDDKIELNRQMNETLEAVARAIFKSWFVDFDPVRATAVGREPGLTKHIADLFPDRFEDLELNKIPESWRIGVVGDLGEVICGKTPPTCDPENYGAHIPFVTIPDMHGKVFVTATSKSLSSKGAATQYKKTLPSGAICVSCIATVGLVVLTSECCQTNQQINSLIPIEPDSSFYCYFALQRLADGIRSWGSGGSVVLNLNKGHFAALPVLVPSKAVAAGFQQLVGPIFDRILANDRESRTLAVLRDVLLPKLLSGDLPMRYRA